MKLGSQVRFGRWFRVGDWPSPAVRDAIFFLAGAAHFFELLFTERVLGWLAATSRPNRERPRRDWRKRGAFEASVYGRRFLPRCDMALPALTFRGLDGFPVSN